MSWIRFLDSDFSAQTRKDEAIKKIVCQTF
jgi:hypothetical protein